MTQGKGQAYGSAAGTAAGAGIGAFFGNPAMGARIGGTLGGGIGGLFGNGGKPSVSTTEHKFLNDDQLFRQYGAADRAMTRAEAMGPYRGQTYQGLTPEQQEVLARSRSFSLNNQPGAGRTLDASGDLVEAGANFGRNARSLFSDALSRNPDVMRKRAFSASQGPMADRLVDSATRDVRRTLNESVMPGIQNAITNAGGRNSSRAGAAEAIAQRGAADRIADISSGIRQNLYDSEFSKMRTGERDRMSDAYGANSQLSSAFGAGVSGQGSGISYGGQLLNMQGGAADTVRSDMQARLDDAALRFDRERFDGFDLADRYQRSVGPATVSSTTTTGTPGIAPQTATQGMNQGASTGFNMGELFGGFMKGGA